jgi:adenylate kinase family enzyme
MKISIIGHSGAGKSTLAYKLANYYNLPILYLDTVKFLPGWRERPDEEITQVVDDFLANNAQWVIDGNYFSFGFQRFAQADLIIYLNYSRRVCLSQAYQRLKIYQGTTRESMTPGCPEKIDWEFLKWILIDGRSQRRMRQFAELQKTYPSKLITFNHPQQLHSWMNGQSLQ